MFPFGLRRCSSGKPQLESFTVSWTPTESTVTTSGIQANEGEVSIAIESWMRTGTSPFLIGVRMMPSGESIPILFQNPSSSESTSPPSSSESSSKSSSSSWSSSDVYGQRDSIYSIRTLDGWVVLILSHPGEALTVGSWFG